MVSVIQIILFMEAFLAKKMRKTDQKDKLKIKHELIYWFCYKLILITFGNLIIRSMFNSGLVRVCVE